MKNFDAYEIIGIIAPGAVLLYALLLVFPELKGLYTGQGFSVGDLGVFVILAFVAGHLVQAVGEFVERPFWRLFGGMPTDWVNNERRALLDPSQRTRVLEILGRKHKPAAGGRYENWPSIVREVYADAQRAASTARIDAFNRTYGLLRGVSIALVVVTLCVIAQNPGQWKYAALTLLLAALAGYRMFGFGVTYGREVFVQFLALQGAAAKPSPTPAPVAAVMNSPAKD